MGGNNTSRNTVYELFADGKSIPETTELTKLSYGKVKAYYTDFIVAQAKQNPNNYNERLLQIRSVETELFGLYTIKKSTDIDRKRIRKLEHTYVHFNALK